MFNILIEIKALLDNKQEIKDLVGSTKCVYADENTPLPYICLVKNSMEANTPNKQYTEIKGSVGIMTVSSSYSELVTLIDYINDCLHMKKTPSGYHIEFSKLNNEFYVPEEKIFISEIIYNVI